MKSSPSPKLENKSDIKDLEQFKESEDLFRKIFEQAAVGIAHVSLNGNFIRINQKFCDIVGYSEQEMLKLTFQDITDPDDLTTDLEYYEQMLARDIKTCSIEKRYLHKDTSIVWIKLTVSLVWKDNGEPDYFIAVVEDITKRKLAEDRFKLLIEQASDALRNSSNKKADQSFTNKEKNGK